MNKSSSDNKSSRNLIKRLIFGSLVGIFLALIYWSYSAYFHVPLSLTHGIISTLFLAIACGVIAAFTSIDKLMDNFPSI